MSKSGGWKRTVSAFVHHPVESARFQGRVAVTRGRRRVSRTRLAEVLPATLWLWSCGWTASCVAEWLGSRSSEGFTLVQIGANDGELADPVHAAISRFHWRAVLVEPIPWIFDRLVGNYGDVDTVVFENAAIGASDGTGTMYYVDVRDDDPEFATALATFERGVLESHSWAMADIKDRILQIDIPTLRLESLLRRHGVERVDLLLIDAEGYDFEIVQQIDFRARWAPRFMIFEIKHLDQGTRRRARRLLRRSGYKWFEMWDDVFVYRELPKVSKPRATLRCRRETERG